ncbi:MAG: sigma factor-like helix-turn-helix DNA-binding protein, partial [Bacteroidota bacterium]
ASETRNDQDGLGKAYQAIGNAYLMKNDLAQAETYLKRAEGISGKLGIKVTQKAVYLDLKNLSIARRDYPAAMEYFEQYVAVSDSMFNEEKATQMANLEIQHAISSQEQTLKIKQQEIALLEQQNRISNLLRWLMLTLFGVISYFAWRYFRYQQFRIRRNRDKLEREQELRKAESKQAETELNLAQATNEQLKEQLEQKNRELTSYTLNFIRKNELMEELRSTISEIKKAASGSISSKLSSLQRQVDSALNIDKDWEDFRLHFEQVHSGFFTRLKASYPELSGNDLKLCALIRLNLSSKEIATMLGISPDSVKTARYRLRKKLQLDREDNLLDFMTSADAYSSDNAMDQASNG